MVCELIKVLATLTVEFVSDPLSERILEFKVINEVVADDEGLVNN